MEGEWLTIQEEVDREIYQNPLGLFDYLRQARSGLTAGSGTPAGGNFYKEYL